MTEQILHIEKLYHHPVAAFAMDGFWELRNKGFVSNTSSYFIPVEARALVMMVDDKPLSIIAFDADGSKLSITISYTAPEHRGNGYHSRLWKELVATAQRENFVVIKSTIHAQNDGMIAAARKQGRTEQVWHTFTYNVTGTAQ